jgi:hypothetical protein
MRDVEQRSELTFASEDDVAKRFLVQRIRRSFSRNVDERLDVNETSAYRGAGDVLAKRPDADQQGGARRT